MGKIHHEWHIWELAEEHDVTVQWSRKRKHSQRDDDSWGGTAYARDRFIEIHWQSEGEDAYWVALHELGHVVLGHCGLPATPEGTAGEAEAWAWALKHAVARPTPTQVYRIERRLGGYAAERGDHERRHEVMKEMWDAALWSD